jgi:hypothetical protein
VRVGNQVSLQLRIGDLLKTEVKFFMIFNRSLMIGRTADYATMKSLLTNLEQLAEEGFFKNNRQLVVRFRSDWPLSPPLFGIIRPMINLEILKLDCQLKIEQVAQLFQSCPKLTELHLRLDACEMDADLKNQLRPGFQRHRLVELEWYMDNNMWSVIQEMCT